MTTCQSLTLTNGPRSLEARLHLPSVTAPRPLVVLCHGFKSFMDWGFHPPLAELLCERGFAVLQFNFSGGGVAPGEDVVSDPKAFFDATYTRDVEDLLSVLDAVPRLDPRHIDASRVALVGHSRGGGIALLAAATEPWTNRLAALVTWNSIGEVDRFGEATAEWRKTGELPIHNGRTGQTLPIGLDLLDDIEKHREELDLRAAAARRRSPWLLLHGTEDETVALAEGEALASVAAQPFQMERILEGSHTFGAQHPFSGPTPQLITAMNATQEWLARYLRRV